MPRHDHDRDREAGDASAPTHTEFGDTENPAHPLLDLQQRAGNAAVAQLLALQRHSLVPEEEAG
jgi:hypothetical protein